MCTPLKLWLKAAWAWSRTQCSRPQLWRSASMGHRVQHLRQAFAIGCRSGVFASAYKPLGRHAAHAGCAQGSGESLFRTWLLRATHWPTRFAAWRSGTPVRCLPCAVAPAQRGRGLGCIPRHRPRGHCAGSSASLCPQSSSADHNRRWRTGCAAESGLHMGHGIRINADGWVKVDVRRCGLDIGITCHLLQHTVNRAHMKMHMLVETGAKR